MAYSTKLQMANINIARGNLSKKSYDIHFTKFTPCTDACDQQFSIACCVPEDGLMTNQNLLEI